MYSSFKVKQRLMSLNEQKKKENVRYDMHPERKKNIYLLKYFCPDILKSSEKYFCFERDHIIFDGFFQFYIFNNWKFWLICGKYNFWFFFFFNKLIWLYIQIVDSQICLNFKKEFSERI